jgi:hypothetical protein
LGDGTTASGPVVTHTYRTHGIFTARLTVTDDGGPRTRRRQLSRSAAFRGNSASGRPEVRKGDGSPSPSVMLLPCLLPRPPLSLAS